jgi:transposase
MHSLQHSQADPLAACIGWDWGCESHAIALRETGTHEAVVETLPATPEAILRWLDATEARFGGRTVAIALEGSRGPVFSQLLERPWIRIYSVHPATSTRMRNAFSPSGAKDDKPDALVLLDLVETSRHKLRTVSVLDPATARVEQLVELRRDMVDRRTQLTNQLDGLLKKYFPQALKLTGAHLHSDLALDFLKRWPSLVELKAVRPATLTRFYHSHNVRNRQTIDDRLKLVAEAKFVTTDQQRTEIWKMELACLVAQVRVLTEHLAGVDQQVADALRQHPDADLFTGLPGAGPVFAPRLVAAFGTDRGRYEDADSLQKLAGVAPVMERSGKSTRVKWRWQASRFLRQTFVEWSRCTIATSAWAGAYFAQQKARGVGNWTIYRSLAYKWIRILWKCWQSRRPYNEAQYLDQLARRGSPLAASLGAKLA